MCEAGQFISALGVSKAISWIKETELMNASPGTDFQSSALHNKAATSLGHKHVKDPFGLLNTHYKYLN